MVRGMAMRWVAVALVAMGILVQVRVAEAAPQRRVRRAAAAHAPADVVKNIFWEPNEVKQGSVVFFTVELQRPARRVTATWAGKTLTFFRTKDAMVWHALAGVDLESQPQDYELDVTAVLTTGAVTHGKKTVTVLAATFKVGSVDVPQNYVEPNAEEQKEIAADEKLKERAWAHATPEPLWSGDFKKPVNAASTESFGESRILNEERSSLHRGTDYPASEGSVVAAANAGTVVLAAPLFYEGNCVVIDHGQKFFTIYMHLSKMDVAAGDKVQKGQRLGLSGATGRVTGPHLHFGVRWNGAYLDPVELLSLTLPQTKTVAEERTPVVRRRRPARRR